MPPSQSKQNYTPHPPEDYDANISSIIPYYSAIHQEIINFIKSLQSSPKVWMDTGCGTGSLVSRAIETFPDTRFLLVDPTEGMLNQAKSKLSLYPAERLEFLKASTTQEFSQKLDEKPDIITAVQCHHYLNSEDRAKATCVCCDLLKEGGIYITFENIRPLTEEGIIVGKRFWSNYQLSRGRNEEDVKKHLERFDNEYFPITIEEHLKLLREKDFKVVELFWYSYMQAGFYCIK